MKKYRFLVIVILAMSLVIGLIFIGCAPEKTDRLKVVTTTSLLTYIVEQVGGDEVDVVSIIPPTQHPGDFDASPGDIQQLADADLFLWHNWPGEVFVPGLIESADNPGLTVVAVEIQGNWMTPPVQLQAADKVAAALSQVDSQNSEAYEKGATEYKQAVSNKEAEIRGRLADANLPGIKALVSFWQAGFAEWAGFKVISTYGPAELTIDATRTLVDKGRGSGVSLVIDNLQSGRDAGKVVAEELSATRVILSNFPGGYVTIGTWEEEIDYNIELLLEAVSQ